MTSLALSQGSYSPFCSRNPGIDEHERYQTTRCNDTIIQRGEKPREEKRHSAFRLVRRKARKLV